MRRSTALMGVAAVAVMATNAFAQAKTNFAGTWNMVVDSAAMAQQQAMGGGRGGRGGRGGLGCQEGLRLRRARAPGTRRSRDNTRTCRRRETSSGMTYRRRRAKSSGPGVPDS